jgi:hypothetical protein
MNEEIYILRGLVRRINNKIFGYKKRGRDASKRKKRSKKRRT